MSQDNRETIEKALFASSIQPSDVLVCGGWLE